MQVSDLRFRGDVERLYGLGLKSLAEILAKLGAARSIRTVIDQKLERYAALHSEGFKAIDGDSFWPKSLRKVRP